MEDKIFFNSKYEFDKWLIHENRSCTFVHSSSSYENYDCYFSSDICCYVLRNYKPCFKERFWAFFDVFGVPIFFIFILGVISTFFIYFLLLNDS